MPSTSLEPTAVLVEGMPAPRASILADDDSRARHTGHHSATKCSAFRYPARHAWPIPPVSVTNECETDTSYTYVTQSRETSGRITSHSRDLCSLASIILRQPQRNLRCRRLTTRRQPGQTHIDSDKPTAPCSHVKDGSRVAPYPSRGLCHTWARAVQGEGQHAPGPLAAAGFRRQGMHSTKQPRPRRGNVQASADLNGTPRQTKGQEMFTSVWWGQHISYTTRHTAELLAAGHPTESLCFAEVTHPLLPPAPTLCAELSRCGYSCDTSKRRRKRVAIHPLTLFEAQGLHGEVTFYRPSPR